MSTNNPFEDISTRLGGVESLLSEVLKRLEQQTPTVAAVGGLELAQELTGLSKATIYKLVSERKICHSKRGNKLYFNRAELLDWVAQGNREVMQEGGARG